MTGRLYVNTASNEIIGHLGIIMDRMAIGPGRGNIELKSKLIFEDFIYNENHQCVRRRWI